MSMSEQEMVIEVASLNISFGGPVPFHAVRDLNFSIRKGETLAIVGESGSGKSLTALSLMGLLPAGAAVSGSIILEGHGVAGATFKEWRCLRGSKVGMVFQEPMSALNPVMAVGKQLSESIRAHRSVSRREARQHALEWISRVKLPDPQSIFKRYPHQLSGGQKQRMMIAMAMCNHPALLIADEPTTALDATVQKDIILLMKELQVSYGTALLFITHDLGLAASIANTLIVMRRGEAVECGHAGTVLSDPRHPYTRALLDSRPSAEKKGKPLPVTSDNETLPGSTSGKMLLRSGSPPSVLEINDLHVRFPVQKSIMGKVTRYFDAVRGVSFQVKPGETVGLVGESGCGKTTIGRTIMGLNEIAQGSIRYGSHVLEQMPRQQWQSLRRQVQLIFQDPFASLNPRMSIADILAEPLRTHRIVPEREVRQEAERLICSVGLPVSSLDRYPHQFSGGQRQRIGIARALAVRPQLLICDESVSALDVRVQAQVLNLLKELQQSLGISCLFISHDLAVVHYMSDRVIVMKEGRVVETGTANEILLQPTNPYTRQLIAAVY